MRSRRSKAVQIGAMVTLTAFLWSFAFAPIASAASQITRDAVAKAPKPLPRPKNLGSTPFTVPKAPAIANASVQPEPADPAAAIAKPALLPAAPPSLTLLDQVARFRQYISPTQVDAWDTELHGKQTTMHRAAQLAIWLGEYALVQNEDPHGARTRFAAARNLTTPRDPLFGLASYDSALALFYEGAYQESAAAFFDLVSSPRPLPGFDFRLCAYWYRHAATCAGVHNEHAKIGVPEPPRLDPLCGAAALAASLQALRRPYDRATVLKSCRVTGEGSDLHDLVAAGPGLGVSVRSVTADEQGLILMPKPAVAYVERDHFVSVVRADKRGVSYLCSDCGAWPGGRVDLTWKQWRTLSPGIYATVTLPGSDWDQALTQALSAAGQRLPVASGTQVSYVGSLSNLTIGKSHPSRWSEAARHVHPLLSGPGSTGCGSHPVAPPCPITPGVYICCPNSLPGSHGSGPGTNGKPGTGGKPGAGGNGNSGGGGVPPPHSSAGPSSNGDPVNMATGEEEYQPSADMTIYNPNGPSVAWQRRYNSLRASGNGDYNSSSPTPYDPSTPEYECSDYGSEWSQNYNVGIYDPSRGTTGTKYLYFDNGAEIAVTPTGNAYANHINYSCTLTYNGSSQGIGLLVNWNYDSASGKDYFQVTFPDRKVWIMQYDPTTSGTSVSSYVLRQIRSRMSTNATSPNALLYGNNAITFNYTSPLTSGGFPLLSTITDAASSTTLLSVTRTGDLTGNITQISDAYGRSVYYQCALYHNLGISSPYNVAYQELGVVSQIVPTSTSYAPGFPPFRYRYSYGPVRNHEGGEYVQFLSGILVPNPNGTGAASVADIQYDPKTAFVSEITDGNGNHWVYSASDSSGDTEYSTYSSPYTKVIVTSPTFHTVYSSFVGYDTNASQTTQSDGNGKAVMTINSFDPNNPYRPASVTDGNGKTTTYAWDTYNNLRQVTSPRGTVTNYTYAFPTMSPPAGPNSEYQTSAFALGELASVQEGSKTATTYTYNEPSGLVSTVGTPTPGTVGGATVSTTFDYDNLGNLTQQVTPGNGTASSITTNYNYTTDGTYSQADALGQPLTTTDNLGNVTHLRYDVQRNLTSATDAIGNTTYFGTAPGNPSPQSGYNIANQLVLVTFPATGQTGTGNAAMMMSYAYPDGPAMAMKNYDESGSQIREVDATYGNEGEVSSVTGSTEPVYYTYDALYRLKTLTDGSGHATSPTKSTAYFYNTAGYLYQVAYPGAATTTPTMPLLSGSSDTVTFTNYDSKGDVTQRVDGRNVTTNYLYNDPENKLTDEQYPASSALNVHYDYDSVYGRWSGMADAVSGNNVSGSYSDGVIYAYDDNNVVTSISTIYHTTSGSALPTWKISYTYNSDGSRSGMTLQDTTDGTPTLTSSYTYDGAGRLTGLTNPYSESSSWTYLANNWLSTQTLGNGITTTDTYDARGNIAGLAERQSSSPTSALLADFGGTSGTVPGVSYDAEGNLAGYVTSGFPSGTNSLNGTTTYSYDARNELTSESTTRYYGTTTSNAYQYDGVTSGTTMGAGNGTSIKGVSFSYSANGDNQIASDGLSNTYGFDGNGNPTTYKSAALTFDPENRMTAYGTTLTAGYTGGSLRAWKQDGSGNRTYFLYDGQRVLAEVTGTGGLSAYQTWGVDGLLSRHTASGDSFYTYDPTGSVATVSNATGAVQGDELYDATGKHLNFYVSTPVSFCGQWGYYEDVETGLMLCGHRYYDSYTARFINRDPIGHRGGINLYGCTRNNFVNQVDPSGEFVPLGPFWSGVIRTAAEIFGALDNLLNGPGPNDPDMEAGEPPSQSQVGSPPPNYEPPTYPGEGPVYYCPTNRGGSGGPGAPSMLPPASSPGVDGDGSGDAGGGTGVGGTGGGDGGFAPPPSYGDTNGMEGTEGGCVSGDTPVMMADGTLKPIALVQAGDMILTISPDTNHIVAQRVLNTESVLATETYIVSFSDGEKIEMSREHPLYVMGRGFVHASEFSEGLECSTLFNKCVTITGIAPAHHPIRVFGLRVSQFQNYFVGAASIRTHK